MNANIAAIVAVLIPVVTEAGVRWDKFPLERKNAPYAVVALSLILAVVYVWSQGAFAWNAATVDSVFGLTAVTVGFAAVLYEYVWKAFLLKVFVWAKSKLA
jgi:hypothetical protein